MIIAGAYLTDYDVTALSAKLTESGFADLAGRLEVAHQLDTRMFHLSADEHEAFVRALDDCPDELRHVRAGLQEQQLVDQPV